MTSIWGQFHKEYLGHQLINVAWNYLYVIFHSNLPEANEFRLLFLVVFWCNSISHIRVLHNLLQSHRSSDKPRELCSIICDHMPPLIDTNKIRTNKTTYNMFYGLRRTVLCWWLAYFLCFAGLGTHLCHQYPSGLNQLGCGNHTVVSTPAK